jgi:hypothetical protein
MNIVCLIEYNMSIEHAMVTLQFNCQTICIACLHNILISSIVCNILKFFTALVRLAGYYLYVSNSTTSKNDGFLCYHHSESGPSSAHQNRTCNHLGKHVIIYNERNKGGNNPAGYTTFAILELCKVIINGK